MSKGTHYTVKSKNDPTYNAAWSGVSYAPHCGCICKVCGEPLHLESDTHYCPRCDDFVQGNVNCKLRSKGKYYAAPIE